MCHFVFCECAQPKLLGMCCLSLKSILQAENLLLDRTLEVKDRSRGAGHHTTSTQDNDWPLVGHLRVRAVTECDVLLSLSGCNM